MEFSSLNRPRLTISPTGLSNSLTIVDPFFCHKGSNQRSNPEDFSDKVVLQEDSKLLSHSMLQLFEQWSIQRVNGPTTKGKRVSHTPNSLAVYVLNLQTNLEMTHSCSSSSYLLYLRRFRDSGDVDQCHVYWPNLWLTNECFQLYSVAKNGASAIRNNRGQVESVEPSQLFYQNCCHLNDNFSNSLSLGFAESPFFLIFLKLWHWI